MTTFKKNQLIKINPDHYIIVDDSEIIKEGDWIYSFDNELILQANKGSVDTISSKSFNGKGFAKITYSTQPLNTKFNDWFDAQIITLAEVKELLGEVDVEKKVSSFFPLDCKDLSMYHFGIAMYNQALEDNKEKKYTEEDIHKALSWGYHAAKDETKGISSSGYGTRFIQSLQPKTEWEVEFENGKLRLV